jgi:hypothetical protein
MNSTAVGRIHSHLRIVLDSLLEQPGRQWQLNNVAATRTYRLATHSLIFACAGASWDKKEKLLQNQRSNVFSEFL